MVTMPAADAKTNFGALLDKAQRGPVTISKNGRAVAVVMSVEEFEKHQLAKLQLLREEVRKGMDSAKRGKTLSSRSVFSEIDRDLGD